MALFKACLIRTQLMATLLVAAALACAPSYAVEKTQAPAAQDTSTAKDAATENAASSAKEGAGAAQAETKTDAGTAQAAAGAAVAEAKPKKKVSGPDAKALRGEAQPGGKNLTIERTFSVSHISVPKRCEETTYKRICTRLVNYYARRFERDMVTNYSASYMNNSELLDRDNYNAYRDRERGVQNVTMSMYSPPGDPVMTLFTIFKQHIPNREEEVLIVETINFDSRTGKFIPFKDLFENSELAAMLCARAIEKKYQKYNSRLLPVVISATQLRPTNFIITANGLRFFFAPGLVKPESKSAESIFIKLDKLKAAHPNMKWWDGKVRTVTQDQRDALKNSSLSKVIDLDESDQQLKEK